MHCHEPIPELSAAECGLDSGSLAMLRISVEAPGYLHAALHCAMLSEERAHNSTLPTCTSDWHQARTGSGLSNPDACYVRIKVLSYVPMSAVLSLLSHS